MGGFSKTLAAGPAGSVVFAEQGGVVSFTASLGAAAGGGDVAGFASIVGSVGIQLSLKELLDAAMELGAKKYPGAALAFEEAKALIDAELAKN